MKIKKGKLLSISLAVMLCFTTLFHYLYFNSNDSIAKAASSTVPEVSAPDNIAVPEKETQSLDNSPIQPKTSQIPILYTSISSNSPAPSYSPTPSFKPSPSTTPSYAYTLKEGQWYYIKNAELGGYLQVADNKSADGQNVIISPEKGNAGSKWCFKPCSSSAPYQLNDYIFNGLGDFYLGMDRNAEESGTNIVVHSDKTHGLERQRFDVRPYSTAWPQRFIISSPENFIQISSDSLNTLQKANVTLGGGPYFKWLLEEAEAPYPSPTLEPLNISLDFSTLTQWDNGYVGELVITNNSDIMLKNWMVTFKCGTISSLWGAELFAQSEANIAIKNYSWAAALSPGESVTIGFVSTDISRTISDIKFYYS